MLALLSMESETTNRQADLEENKLSLYFQISNVGESVDKCIQIIIINTIDIRK